jgi:hypothetical protein
MKGSNSQQGAVTVITLGPEGTCHERAVLNYLAYQGIEDYELVLTTDLFAGLDQVRETPGAFLVQCSAHPEVHKITEKYWTEVFVVDTFIYPTKALAVLSRTDVENPRSLGIVPATKGYLDLAEWDEVVDVVSKPVVAAELLEGRYDAGLTHLEHLAKHPEELRLDLEIGEIDTTWVVYGRQKRFQGEVIGIPSANVFAAAAEEAQRVVA